MSALAILVSCILGVYLIVTIDVLLTLWRGRKADRRPKETLRLDLTVPDDLCCICRKIPRIRLVLDVVYEGVPARVSVCRDCLAEYAPETLAVIEAAAGVSQ